MEEKIKLICDRIEEGIAVLLSDDDTIFHISAEELTVLSGEKTAENNCYLCAVCGERIVTAEKTVNESAGANKERLSALFKKSEDKQQPLS